MSKSASQVGSAVKTLLLLASFELGDLRSYFSTFFQFTFAERRCQMLCKVCVSRLM